jgi:predicted outer membrane repeat protein
LKNVEAENISCSSLECKPGFLELINVNGTIVSSNFKNNFGLIGGGVIYLSNDYESFIIFNSSFIQNRAKYFGGAIYALLT